MIPLFELTTPLARCSYQPGERASMHYTIVGLASAADYQAKLQAGWRRFGRSFFHPVCPNCQKCQSLRVPVATFRPNRSQLRARAANADIRLVIGEPYVTAEKLWLYDRFHEFQSDHVGWREHDPKDPNDYVESFVDNPFPTEEWCYYLDDRLVGVGYIDALPDCLSAIYFFYNPDLRNRSLGTFNVLCTIDAAIARNLTHVYLGYFVDGCRSSEYKARFQPNEVLSADDAWVGFRT
jgi:arginine-tRNA-protein transferase